MNARRAARELILMSLSQIKIKEAKKINIDELVLNAMRTLINDSQEELKLAIGELIDVKEYVDVYEMEDETNLNRPIGAKNKSVKLPRTKEMSEKIDTLLDVTEKCLKAAEISELTVLSETKDVKEYMELILNKIKENIDNIDEQIKEHTVGWDISRLVSIDLSVLRMSIAELLYVENVPVKVIIDEAVELVKKYSTEDSPSFVNGILGKIVDENEIKR